MSVVLALAGCGGDDSSGTNGPGADGARADAFAWEVRELLRIGAVDGPPEATFGRVAALELDGAGNVYVLDAQVPVVRVFDGQGNHLGDLGGPGEGPGEFQGPGGLVLEEDRRIWVVDWRLMRYTAFDLDTAGTAGANEPPPRLDGSVATWRREFSAGFGGHWNASVDASGRLYEPTTIWGPTGELERVILALEPADGRMQAVDTLLLGPVREPPSWSVSQTTSSGGLVVEGGLVPVPFVPRNRLRAAAGGGVWEGRTDRPQFVNRSLAGDTLEVRGREVSPRPVTQGDIDAAMAELEDRFGEGVQADMAEIPEYLPHWNDFVIDDRGRIWAERYHPTGAGPEDGAEWEVYGADGTLLGAVTLPVRSTPSPRFAEGRIVGVLEDELGVSFVVVLQVEER